MNELFCYGGRVGSSTGIRNTAAFLSRSSLRNSHAIATPMTTL